MWKSYSASYIKQNRASSISIMVAALIASLFLSLLCSLFYNFWIYEIENIIIEEGDWQGRIVGKLSENDINIIQNFASVDKVVIHGKMPGESGAVDGALSDGQELVADVYFQDMRSVYRVMPRIAEKLNLECGAVSYNELLLSRYLIHDPQDESPPLLLTFYLVVLMIVSISLILIIHNSFAVSMNARIHQFGIFSSIGATPAQIRTCLMQEAAALCIIPVLLGSFIGIVLSFGVTQATNWLAAEVKGRHEAVFQYRIWIWMATLLVSGVTVLVSAWLPARKLSRLTPMQAIHNTGGLQLKKKKHSRVLSALFGIEGELAGNALKAQRQAMRTSTLSLTLSFLGFTMMLCFLTLSGISTNHTYFERYQDAWDVMITVKDTQIEDFAYTGALRDLPGVQGCVVYQKAAAEILVPQNDISEELNAIGGLEAIAGISVAANADGYQIQAPMIVMDDASFMEYCEQIGVMTRLDGVIVLNRIWDSVNSNFRYPEYVPFLKETYFTENQYDMITLQNAERPEYTVDIPITAYTQEVPRLREEYDDYSLVQILPLSLWRGISGQIGNAAADTYIRILGKKAMTLAEANLLESEVMQIVRQGYTVESENRIQERLTNDSMIKGFMLITGAFCALLALIGFANIYSNTVGFLRQRKREFAQYMSVGMTQRDMWKMFGIEVLVIAGKPFVITLPLTVVSVGFMITMSYLDPMEFLVKAPIVPIAGFIMAIFGFVGVAYYIGGKRVLNSNLIDALKNDGAW